VEERRGENKRETAYVKASIGTPSGTRVTPVWGPAMHMLQCTAGANAASECRLVEGLVAMPCVMPLRRGLPREVITLQMSQNMPPRASEFAAPAPAGCCALEPHPHNVECEQSWGCSTQSKLARCNFSPVQGRQ